MATFCVLEILLHSVRWRYGYILWAGDLASFCVLEIWLHSVCWRYGYILWVGDMATFCGLEIWLHAVGWRFGQLSWSNLGLMIFNGHRIFSGLFLNIFKFSFILKSSFFILVLNRFNNICKTMKFELFSGLGIKLNSLCLYLYMNIL